MYRDDVSEIYDKLQDDESKRIFDAYYNNVFQRNYDMFLDELIDYKKGYKNTRWQKFKDDLSVKKPKVVIWGAGHDGIRTYKLLKSLNENIVCFADNDLKKQGVELIDNIRVFSIDDVYSLYSDAIQVLATRNYCHNLYEQLLIYGFQRKLIYYPPYRRMTGSVGKQYFDCPEILPTEDEVFVDAGSYDGMTAVQFSDWCGGTYRKIYSFDPDIKCKTRIQNNIVKYGLHDVEFIPCGLSDKTKEQRFNSTGMAGAAVSDIGNETIKVTSIDETLNGDKATFIKMDIEGSEYEALLGAKQTIEKYHPRLAICIYHKPLDFIEIPQLILSISKDYRFYIRHYTCCEWETVLYAL